MKYRTKHHSGFSLVEAIVVAALSALVFGALFASFQYSLQLVNNSRAKLSAQSVANDRMEFFRSLPYDEVGVIAGFPAGLIPQNSTTTLNGIEFAERVRVEYIDDDADGSLTLDANGIITDYKQIRLEYTWQIGNATSSIMLLSNIVPRSIETNVGGGTIRINVLNADSTILPGANVRIIGSSTTAPINIPGVTDVNGAAIFAVPADSGYSVEVSANIAGSQYSFDGTYPATTSNPNPTTAPFAVLESDVSTLTFTIGELSDLDIQLNSAVLEGSMLEEFPNLDGVASSTNVDTAFNSLVLSDVLGAYQANGIAYLESIRPATLESWEVVRVAADLPTSDTDYVVQFYTGTSTGTYTLIPNSDLPGNASGFTDSIIDISNLDTVTYPELTVGISLETSDPNETPAIDELAVYYTVSSVPVPAVPIVVTSSKAIGSNSSSSPIFKYLNAVIADGGGRVSLTDMEFDQYTLGVPSSYDIASACPSYPVVHRAGINTQASVLLVSNAVHTLRVQVVDGLGRAVPGAEVNLSRPGYNLTLETNTCGQVFFTGGINADTDYALTTSVAGYATDVQDPFTVDGDSVGAVLLVP